MKICSCYHMERGDFRLLSVKGPECSSVGAIWYALLITSTHASSSHHSRRVSQESHTGVVKAVADFTVEVIYVVTTLPSIGDTTIEQTLFTINEMYVLFKMLTK